MARRAHVGQAALGELDDDAALARIIATRGLAEPAGSAGHLRVADTFWVAALVVGAMTSVTMD